MASDITIELDGVPVVVPDDGGSLLEALRERAGHRAAKDGCSPQGQCGCCTVLVDGAPRVACVTPLRRVAGRRITTVDGLPPEERAAWVEAFVATGASQCGFCTPGIVCRLAGAEPRDRAATDRALAAHLCRCTGWQTIVEAVERKRSGARAGARDLEAAARRATIEGGVAQTVGPEAVLGRAGFADDTAPPGALVAVPDGRGGWALGETLGEARVAAGKVQGRRTTAPPRPPLEVPAGEWVRTLRTTWVEPAYLEPDASWCEPGGTPASPIGNGGAFGGKVDSIAPAVARRLADEHGRAVRVVLAREDTVRLGPKRPPLAAGIRADGTGEVVVARTPGIADAIASVAPGMTVTEIDVPGPPTSAALRAAGWAEAAVLLAAVAGDPAVRVVSPAGATATARVGPDGAAPGTIEVTVDAGDPLDPVVLRSYCIGAAHMALGWVTSEGVHVDDAGVVHDLTIRSFGIVRPAAMPAVEVTLTGDGPPVNGSDAVFAAVAAAVWMGQGCPQDWPVSGGSNR